MAEEGLIVNLLLGKRKWTTKGALVDVAAFATITIIGGFFFGIGMNAANIALRSALREINYNPDIPFVLPRSLSDEVSTSAD
jgi:hypothetical protein